MSDLHKVMETQCQHLTMTQRNELLKLLQIFEDFFDGTLGIWKIDPVYLDLKRMQSKNLLATIPSTEDTRGNV